MRGIRVSLTDLKKSIRVHTADVRALLLDEMADTTYLPLPEEEGGKAMQFKLSRGPE